MLGEAECEGGRETARTGGYSKPSPEHLSFPISKVRWWAAGNFSFDKLRTFGIFEGAGKGGWEFREQLEANLK